jgi:ArsR family transcriptional regulator
MATDALQPLYRMKADFFKTLAHPARIRVLELLSTGERTVSELLPDVSIEPTNLSQQLAILRRAGLVAARREGLTVSYTLATPRVVEMLDVARAILTSVIAGQAELLDQHDTGPPDASDNTPARRPSSTTAQYAQKTSRKDRP